MKHELPGFPVRELDHVPLRLTHGDRVGELIGLERRSSPVEVKEIGVKVDRIQRIEFGDVYHVRPLELVGRYLNWLIEVMKGDGVDGVNLILAIEVRIECVHHHYHFVRLGPAILGINDECSVQPAMDVLGQRERVTVVEMCSEGLGDEVVDEFLTRFHLAGAWHSVHFG